tara:strand:+ start:778 stop:1053 length:276 start_codon:yes stop_codon:yes gene_type:complete
MPFQAEDWVLVGNTDLPYTKEQIEACKSLDLNIKGAILCNDPAKADSDACKMIPQFPAFCNTKTQICVSGLRDDTKLFDELQEYSDNKNKS